MGRRRPRAPKAAVLLVLAAGQAAVAIAAVAAAMAHVHAVFAWNVAFTAGAFSALAGMLLARDAAAPEDRGRWNWWTAGVGAWLVGQLLWNLSAITNSEVVAGLADCGWYLFALAVIGGALRERSRALRAVAALEVVTLIVPVMALIAAFFWDDVTASSLPVARRLLALTYPVVYVSAAVVTLQAIVGGSLRHVRGIGSRVVLVGMTTEAIAFIDWSRQLLSATYVPGESVVDLLFVAGLLAMAAGGVLAAAVDRPGDLPSEGDRWGGLLPGLTFALLVCALIQAEATDAPMVVVLVLMTGLLTCGTLLFLRGSLLERRLRRLLTRERSARQELAASRAELALLNDRLRRDVRRDPLTGLHNRRALAEDLPAIEAHATRHGESYAIALCDIDHFKAYNDALGHLAGDDALRRVASAIGGVLRAGDAAYRYGGEEFLVVLRSTNLRDAELVAARIRMAVTEAALRHPGSPTGLVTMSIGVAVGSTGAAALVGRADAALYEAKRTGRDRAMLAGDERTAAPVRCAAPVDEPIVRHVDAMLGVARAGALGRGVEPVLEALAASLQSELRFQTVVVNLRDEATGDLHVALVAGDERACAALEGTSSPWSAWETALLAATDRNGAYWLPAGAVDWDDSVASWIPPPGSSSDPDAWQPDDMLLLPVRDHSGELIGLVSVDEPLTGRRPDDAQISLLVAVVAHAAVALEHARLRPVATEEPKSGLAAVTSLAEALDLRDAGTAEHSRIVGSFASRTAVALGLDAYRVERVQAAGLVHDLGKIAIADAVLQKPTALDEDEWREIRRHPEIGARILEQAGLGDIARWVRAHHERVDGTGYPDGLSGEDIPLEARILAVADAYEAMIADRPYRVGVPESVARAELLRCAGTQFDREVVAAFLRAQGTAAPVAPDPTRLAGRPSDAVAVA